MINKYIKSFIIRFSSLFIIVLAILYFNPILNKLNLPNSIIKILRPIIIFLIIHSTEKIIDRYVPPSLKEFNKDLYKKELEAKNREENKL